MIIQLGISLMMPLMLCIGACWWLCDTFGVGVWIYIPGMLFGLGGSAMSCWKFYQSVMRLHRRHEEKAREKRRQRTISFNDHI